MLKRHEIKVLLKAGHSMTETAELAGVSLRSVKRDSKESAIEHVDDAAEQRQRGIGRPSLVQNFRKWVIDLLQAEPDLKSVEVFRRARLEGYSGGKRHSMPLCHRFGRKAPSLWCVLKACRANLASMTSARWMSSAWTVRSSGSVSSPPV